MQPIETVYRGYRFRARLEARWAVYFDAIGELWEYESEGFVLNDGTRYLPDFWLPRVQMWAEVKGKPFTDDEKDKCFRLADESGFPCLLLEGMPDTRAYIAAEAIISGDELERQLDFVEFDYVISNHHDYPRSEGRFYVQPGCDCAKLRTPGGCSQCHLDDQDVFMAVAEARSARFEFGENGSGRFNLEPPPPPPFLAW